MIDKKNVNIKAAKLGGGNPEVRVIAFLCVVARVSVAEARAL